MRCAARFDSAEAHDLIIRCAERWVKAFERKPSSAYFEPQDEGWLALFYTDSPRRTDLASMLVDTPHRDLVKLLVDANPKLADRALRAKVTKLDAVRPSARKAVREKLELAAPTAALRKRSLIR